MDFDLFTILPLAAAAFVFWKLRQTLGTRNGAEPPMERYDEHSPAGDDARNDNVVTLPRRSGAEGEAEKQRSADREAAISRIAGTDEQLANGLQAIVRRDVDFDPDEFVGGARAAYEMIVTAFAEGDKDTLQDLLSADVFDSFAGVIDARAEAGEIVQSTFVGIDDARISAAAMERDEAHVTVSFISQIIQATMDSDGEVIDGDPNAVGEIRDRWTFARSVTARDPNWKLVATDDDA